MDNKTLMDVLVQAKRMGNLCNEVMDVSQQLAEAIDRSDQVSVRLLIAMRQEPIDKLTAADRTMRQLLDEAPPEDRAPLAALLNREAEGVTDHEKALANQAAANARVLSKVIEMDKILNSKLSRKRSAEGRS